MPRSPRALPIAASRPLILLYAIRLHFDAIHWVSTKFGRTLGDLERTCTPRPDLRALDIALARLSSTDTQNARGDGQRIPRRCPPLFRRLQYSQSGFSMVRRLELQKLGKQTQTLSG
jgi:hypothetical protein